MVKREDESKQESPNKRNSLKQSGKELQVSKRSKSTSDNKTMCGGLSLASTPTTVSASSNSLAVYPLSTKLSKANRSRDAKASKTMSSLTVRSDPTEQQEVWRFVSIVDTTPLALTYAIVFNCSSTNKDHLKVLLKQQVTMMAKT